MKRPKHKSDTPRPLLHPNYKDAKHAPEWLHIYRTTPKRPCKWCGADPKDIVVYDMPLKNGKRCKVTRCTVCDNLIYAGAERDMPKGVTGSGRGTKTNTVNPV